jgi:rod shape-determining protein MreC
MFRRPHLIALAAVVTVVVIVLNLPPRVASSLKVAVAGLFLPLFGLAGLGQQGLEQAGNALTPRKALLQELEFFRRENAQLKQQLQQTEGIRAENDRLRQALGIQSHFRFATRFARVTARDPSNWWRMISIDRGSQDGVRVNCPVISKDGLVGKVIEVGTTQSRVALIGDDNCQVAAVVQQSRINTGIIVKSSPSPFEYQIVDLAHLPVNQDLKAGQKILTSGLGGVFPPGIIIGEILDFRNVGHGLYQEARVRLAANLNQLEEVWVVMP